MDRPRAYPPARHRPVATHNPYANNLDSIQGYPYTEKVENETGRVVTIETELTPETFAKCLTQEQSPLFRLPGELRTLIFEYVTLPTLDPENLYRENDYYYRPELRGRLVTSAAVLRTCRRVWLEANHLPLQQAEHCFWFQDPERRPPWAVQIEPQESYRLRIFLNHLTVNGRSQLEHVRFFGQMYWLEGFFLLMVTSAAQAIAFAPKILTVTIRHSDWWEWERDAPLRLRDSWVKSLLASSELGRVEVIRLELETLDSKMGELQPIINKLKVIEPPVIMRAVASRFVLQDSSPSSTWEGPTDIGNKPHTIYSHLEKLKYRVTTLIWKLVPAPGEEPSHFVHEEVPNRNLPQPPRFAGLGQVGGVSGFLPIATRIERPVSQVAAAKRWQDRWQREGTLLTLVD